MSRSYKKNPYYTDGRRSTPKDMKRIANRSVRRHDKQITSGYFMRDPHFRDELTLDGMTYRRFFNSWEIHDWISRWTMLEAILEWERPHWIYDRYRDEWYHRWDDFETRKEMEQHWAKYYRRK